ncbi:MAG TPA: 3-phosphoshikimate 1-carboxyvinyltransferase [Candidatus Binataceae bacterium]|nr:3-phosphoshikimate 1-carboxyvinyltransferase [Candidatus Binataceae bacterium]
MDEIEITSLHRPISASIRVPGSKSITNRALILAAMASGRSTLRAAGLNDDTRRMAAALRTLGFEVAIDEAASRIVVEGRGGAIPAAGAELDVGGAGTAMRFLLGFLTLGRGRFRVDGNARMRERPVGPLLDALNTLGVEARAERNNGSPPVVIEVAAGGVRGGAARVDASVSSQFVSALLMPAPLWPDGLRLEVAGEAARPFITMTLRLMERWGARSAIEGGTIIVPGRQRYAAQDFEIEPDASGASYFAAAAALVGGTVMLEGLRADSVQGDIEFVRLLQRMGARVRWSTEGVEVSGTGKLDGVDVAMNAMPDVVPTLAAIAPFCSSPTRIRAVAFIRHHESDRIRTLATELARLGANVHECEDGMLIEPSRLKPAVVETYDDHRIAMAFAVAGLRVEGVRIRNPACVSKTYPDFFRDLAAL